VFVVDDDEHVRESLCALLAVLNFETRAFCNPSDFHHHYRQEMPGCLLLDINMPRQSGLKLYEQLLQEGKRIPVIFITGHADVSTAVAAMKMGAVEFLEKPFDSNTLVSRVQEALALDAKRRRQAAAYSKLNERIDKLTLREQKTLALIQSGATNKAIAARLAISERAVELRRSSIMRKLQVRSTAEVIDMYATHRALAELHRAYRDDYIK
jgi:FixJ family two-component response regulator